MRKAGNIVASNRSGANAQPQRGNRLADQVYDRLLQEIVSSRYALGERLPAENALAKDFSVSRPVIREALHRLQADGLVSARQGSGTFVLRIPPRQIMQLAPEGSIAGILRIFEVRIPLEGYAARLAAERRSKAQLASIGDALDKLSTAMRKSVPSTEPDFAFHYNIALASRNVAFAELLRHLNPTVSDGMDVTLTITRQSSKQRVERVIEEHVRIYEAIAAAEPESAEIAMRYHIDQARKRLTDRSRQL